MNRGFLIILLTFGTVAGLGAQQGESPVPYIPTEQSPFYVLREDANNPTTNAERRLSEQFPRNKDADVSAGKIFTGFFTDMFASVKIGQPDPGRASSRISIEPENFSLDDRREITVTYVVSNKTNELLKLDFPNSQRIEITVSDPTGKVVERWSDDRFFNEVTGVVMINPDERIEYIERIPTREMQPGVTYTIEASVPNYPDFTRTVKVTPTGAARPAMPTDASASPTPGTTPPAGTGVPLL